MMWSLQHGNFGNKLAQLNFCGETFQDPLLQFSHQSQHFKQPILVDFFLHRQQYPVDGAHYVEYGVALLVYVVHFPEALVGSSAWGQPQNLFDLFNGGSIADVQDHLVGDSLVWVRDIVHLEAKKQAWRLLMAVLISPSEMNSKVWRAYYVISTFSPSITLLKLFMISSSFSFPNRNIMHLLWIASIIFEEVLQLRTNLVVSLKLLIIILRACCAPYVRLSASSRIIILVRPGGRDTFFWAKDFIWSRTTSMPLSSEAFS